MPRQRLFAGYYLQFPIFATADDIAAGRGGGFKYLYTGRTSAGAEVWDILNYSCACAQVLYWRAGCRCGTASLDRPWMLDLFSIAYRWHNSRTTEAEEIAKLPAHLRPFWGKQVFHPEPAAWHARRPRRSRAKVFRELQSRARTA